jgi:hypothetical protein
MRILFRGASVLYSHCVLRSMQRPQRGQSSLHFFFYYLAVSSIFWRSRVNDLLEVTRRFIGIKHDFLEMAFIYIAAGSVPSSR